MSDWILYSERRPDVADIYQWRMASTAVKNRVITFYAHMRKRWSGMVDEMAPSFAEWDGFRNRVPDGLQWRTAGSPPKCSDHDYVGFQIEGIELLPCPFCGSVPTWSAVHGDGRATFVNGHPARLNRWWLNCCKWAACPHANPVLIAEERNKAIAARQTVAA